MTSKFLIEITELYDKAQEAILDEEKAMGRIMSLKKRIEKDEDVSAMLELSILIYVLSEALDESN